MLTEQDKEWLSSEVKNQVYTIVTEERPLWKKIIDAVFRVGTPIAVITGIITLTSAITSAKALMFKDEDQKIKVISTVENLPSNEQLYELANHINEPGVHMAKESTDSIYVTRKEYEDLIKNMAIDNYYTKKQVEKMVSEQKKTNKLLDIIMSTMRNE